MVRLNLKFAIQFKQILINKDTQQSPCALQRQR